MDNIKVIAFDGDDTLWINEPYYQEAENRLCLLLAGYAPETEVKETLFRTEMKNLRLYGYGAKGFTLSMIETAAAISKTAFCSDICERIIRTGQELIEKPTLLLEGVEEVLSALGSGYRLILATKGDLLDQRRKLKNCGLGKYFDHIEIMSGKKSADYKALLGLLQIKPSEFMMIGNSMPSDVIPVLELGGYGIHIPYHSTWEHEKAEISNPEQDRFRKLESLKELLPLLDRL